MSGLNLALLLSAYTSSADQNPCLACDREMRKTFEAVQAWRRANDGRYPGRLADLKSAGLLPYEGAICPEVIREAGGADAAHRDASSRGEAGDPSGTYEYEMSDKVLKSGIEKMYLPADAPAYTRQDFKAELLRRPFFEQVAILRCSSHRAAAPPPFDGHDDTRRNATVEGKIYWSRLYWEQLWLDDVSYCAREANVLFGLKGPPFFTPRAPTLPQALDLRKWNCAFGDHAWWWTYPIFDAGANRQTAAHLRPFFEEKHGRSVFIAREEWWLDGLVQLQGRVLSGPKDLYRGPGMEAFVWQKLGVKVERSIAGAAWLQGTAWPAGAGEICGWLVWHYAEGKSERVPIIYGKTTGRFWGDQKQIEGEMGFPEPIWKFQESPPVGKVRWLRVYRQSWTNPHPDLTVSTLDFVSNRDCTAAPFLIAVNLQQ